MISPLKQEKSRCSNFQVHELFTVPTSHHRCAESVWGLILALPCAVKQKRSFAPLFPRPCHQWWMRPDSFLVLDYLVLEICAVSAKKKILFFRTSSLMITNGHVQLGRSRFFGCSFWGLMTSAQCAYGQRTSLRWWLKPSPISYPK